MPDKGKWTNHGCILGDGWSVAWRVLDAQFWGVPQRRRRIALVADFGGQSAPEILFVRQSVSGNTDEGKQKGKGTSSDAERGVGADGCIGFDGYNASLTGGSSSTLGVNCGFTTGRNGVIVYSVDQGGGKSACNVTEGQSPTLTCTHGGEPAVVYNGESITHPLNKTTPLPGDPCHTLGTDSRNWLVQRKYSSNCYTVRRLTPLECERLQGYPDGWTDIGEWTDSNGKTKQSSDAARYKALGNSIALPPWKWVLKRLCACYERDATMASLFDGIGGFPYLWEQLNGKGSCLWASEIEEFPMAVTKVRIGE
jgi:DNA (cytosine-5)-methyltransferase 1